MDSNASVDNYIFTGKSFVGSLDFISQKFSSSHQDLPEIIAIFPLICIVGALLDQILKEFPVILPVILFLMGCSFQILSFTSDKVQRHTDDIQSMDPLFLFDLFTPVIIFNVAFHVDVYMLRKLIWQILLITVPGFFINYALVLWHLATVNNLSLETTPWLLLSAVLVSSDPMLTAAAIRDLGLSRGLINLINAETLMTSIMSFMMFTCIFNFNSSLKKINYSIAHYIMNQVVTSYLASFLFGILMAKLIQFWMSSGFGDDINNIFRSFAILYLIYFACELAGMSGIFTLAITGLLLNSTSFKPGVETLLFMFWNCLSFVAYVVVFTFTGFLIPATLYLHISFSDIFYSLNIYFILIIFRVLIFLLMSPLLSRFGDGFSWLLAFTIVWSEMRGVPIINRAILIAYSDLYLGTERDKSQVLFHGVSVCLLTLVVNTVILPLAFSKVGLRDITSTKFKSLHNTFKHFQDVMNSAVFVLKLDKYFVNADWSMVETAISFQNPYASQGETTEQHKVNCLHCNKEVDKSLDVETMMLANRSLLSAQMASYKRQYRNEILSQRAVQILVGAAGSFGEKGGYMGPETMKNYAESMNILGFVRKVLLIWVYNTKKEKGVPPRYPLLHVFHKIVFTEEFEYAGYLVVLMSMFPIVIYWIPILNDIYENEIRHANYFFLVLYILEVLFKVAAMSKAYLLHYWNIFELIVVLIGTVDIIIEMNATHSTFELYQAAILLGNIRVLRVLRILKVLTPKLLQFVDKKINQQLSFTYDLLKGYAQGEADVMTVIGHFESSEPVKQMLLKRVMENMLHAMKELSEYFSRGRFAVTAFPNYFRGAVVLISKLILEGTYLLLTMKWITSSINMILSVAGPNSHLENDYPIITLTMKTKEEINFMLSLALEIIKDLKLKGFLHESEAAAIKKSIKTQKKELFNFQPTIKPLTILEVLYQIPWLNKDSNYISFFQEGAQFLTFDCGTGIFEEEEEPRGIYIIILGIIKLQRSKPGLVIDQTLCELEGEDHQITYKGYVTTGDIIGELNCLTNKPMKYSATCKTLVEACFIPKNVLYDAFTNCSQYIEYKMWLKIGLSITAQKFRELLPYEDWTYKMQLKLRYVYVKDIPTGVRTDIYDDTVTHVILIHGAVKDCWSRNIYKAPILIPTKCSQVQGTEEFTKVLIVQISTDVTSSEGTVRSSFLNMSSVSISM